MSTLAMLAMVISDDDLLEGNLGLYYEDLCGDLHAQVNLELVCSLSPLPQVHP